MKIIFLVLAILFLGISAAYAQGARQLYLGYENKDKLTAPANSQPKSPAAKAGRPGTKVVIELMRAGKLSLVSPLAVFRSGDKIRLRFATNFDGYLRILNIGSSGKITLLFPYQGADDRLKPSTDFQVPKDGEWILFDNTPGTETMTVVFSRNSFDGQTDENLNRSTGKSRDLMIETGVLNKKLEFSEYADTRFSDKASIQTPWRYEPGIATAK